MDIKSVFEITKADRYTQDGRDQIAKIQETEDKTYQIGEISQKTGLQKTANGWVPPKETKYGKVTEKNGQVGVQQKLGKGSKFEAFKNESAAKRALANYTAGYNTTERSKQDPHSDQARLMKHLDKETEQMARENKKNLAIASAKERIIKNMTPEQKEAVMNGKTLRTVKEGEGVIDITKKDLSAAGADPQLAKEIANSNHFEEQKKEAAKAKQEAELKQQRAEGEANAEAYRKRYEAEHGPNPANAKKLSWNPGTSTSEKLNDLINLGKEQPQTPGLGMGSKYLDNFLAKEMRDRFGASEEAIDDLLDSMDNEAKRNAYKGISKNFYSHDSAPLTGDTRLRLSQVKDRVYKPGEISEKTGLQKQPDGSWAEPKKGKTYKDKTTGTKIKVRRNGTKEISAYQTLKEKFDDAKIKKNRPENWRDLPYNEAKKHFQSFQKKAFNQMSPKEREENWETWKKAFD